MSALGMSTANAPSFMLATQAHNINTVWLFSAFTFPDDDGSNIRYGKVYDILLYIFIRIWLIPCPYSTIRIITLP